MAPTAARSRVGTSWIAVSGRPASRSPAMRQAWIAAALRMRVGAAAQDHGIARLQAERAGIRGDVRAALEDHADDAERRADPLDAQAVRPVPCRDHRADRIGKRGDLLQRTRDRLDARRDRACRGRSSPRSQPASRIAATSAALRREDLGGRGAKCRRGGEKRRGSSPRSEHWRARKRRARASAPMARISASTVPAPRRSRLHCAWRSCRPSIPYRRGGSSPSGRGSRASSRSRRSAGRRSCCASSRSKATRPRPISAPSGAEDDDRVAAREIAPTPPSRRPAAGSCRTRSAATAPASTVRRPRGSRWPAIQAFRALRRRGLRREPGAARARVDRRERVARRGRWRSPSRAPAAVAILPASILVFMPPRDSSEPAAPAIASIAGVIAGTTVDEARLRIARPAARCRARRCRRGAPGSRRRPSPRRAPRAGRCRRSGSRPSPPCRSR